MRRTSWRRVSVYPNGVICHQAHYLTVDVLHHRTTRPLRAPSPSRASHTQAHNQYNLPETVQISNAAARRKQYHSAVLAPNRLREVRAADSRAIRSRATERKSLTLTLMRLEMQFGLGPSRAGDGSGGGGGIAFALDRDDDLNGDESPLAGALAAGGITPAARAH